MIPAEPHKKYKELGDHKILTKSSVISIMYPLLVTHSLHSCIYLFALCIQLPGLPNTAAVLTKKKSDKSAPASKATQEHVSKR